ncbi:dimethylaniline monooxygenase 4 [Caerostris darwini]|uniref:Flavin-containing monooxygenase n=1 Tax=Caerostris darwini TaxID=1538125 RepID=A0AAV4UTI6_9ARAC|nr:dimethylaniline monooxygenase 4 [Caerostris darwini]
MCTTNIFSRSTASHKKKIAVVGGGLSGIISVSCLLEEECFEPICFEKSGEYEGTWRYKEESSEGMASIMPTTISYHSKEIGALSTFPPKKEYTNFMRHHELLNYVTEYANFRNVIKYIQHNSEVL